MQIFFLSHWATGYLFNILRFTLEDYTFLSILTDYLHLGAVWCYENVFLS